MVQRPGGDRVSEILIAYHESLSAGRMIPVSTFGGGQGAIFRVTQAGDKRLVERWG
jgi:hypothetical protein